MAYVGAVYSIQPNVRNSSDILDEVFDRSLVDRPSPANKQVQATMTNYLNGQFINGQEALFADLARQVSQRDPDSKKPLVCLMDGATLAMGVATLNTSGRQFQSSTSSMFLSGSGKQPTAFIRKALPKPRKWFVDTSECYSMEKLIR